MIYGRFIYRRSAGRVAEFEVVVDKTPRGLSIECPMCGRRSGLNTSKHRARVDREGRVTLSRPVLCPNSRCGWFVRVTKGLALDTVAAEDFEPSRPDIPATTLVEGLESRQPVLPGSIRKESLTLAVVSGTERRRMRDRRALPKIYQGPRPLPGPTVQEVLKFSEVS